MSFDFSTLITDRSQADVSAANGVLSRTNAGTATPEELEALYNGTLRGVYDYTDLNRVTACMEYLDAELRKLGYESGYVPIKIDRPDVIPPGRLPTGYTELEYIESTGAQHIDTGVIAKSGVSAKLKYQVILKDSDTWFFSSFNLSELKGWRAGYYEGAYYFDGFSVDNASVGALGTFTGSVVNESPFSMFLFAENRNGAPYGHNAGRLYACEMSDGESLVRDFVPCKSPSSEIGLYDLATAKFFGNVGSGDFVAGPSVPITPIPNPMNPYRWYMEDSQTVDQMDQYLKNVAAIRSVFSMPGYVPQAPKSAALLTFAKANDIEGVLQAVENIIERVSGSLDIGWALGIAHIGLYGGV